MIRVSTTTLEAYRRAVQTEFGNADELAAQIRGEPTPISWQMQAGMAWHSVLAAKDYIWDEEHEWADVGGRSWVFDKNAARSSRNHIGPGLWEVKATTQLDGVTVVAQADHVRGLVIQDAKTKFSNPDARDYEQSLQWRFYLLVHGARLFEYNLFDFADPKGGYCELRNIVSFAFWPYAGMEQDCRRWLHSFLAWAEGRGLLPYLHRSGSSLPVEAAA